MYVKIHRSGERIVVAVADSELIGKTFKDEKYEINVNPSFYKGEEKTEEEVIEILKNADNTNLVGKKAIKAGLKAKIISKENIIIIKGIPHAQSFTL